jgi:hypothetical protein
MPIALTKGLDEKCHLCGFALRKKEIEAEITGTFVDYGERKTGTINLTFCSECWGGLTEISKRDQGDAILKRKELEREGAKKEMPKLDFPDTEIDDFRTPDNTGVGM